MSEPYEIIGARELGREAWNAFADACPEAWLFHRHELLGALSEWPRRADVSFALRDTRDGSVAAVIPLFVIQSRGPRALGFNTLDSLGGPAVNASGREREQIAQAAHARIKELARVHGAGQVVVSLSGMAPWLRGPDCPRVNPLVELGYENEPSQTWVVDLRGGEEAAWKGMEGRARTAVRKAQKLGVTVRPARGAEDLDIYYTLHLETYGRTGAAPHPRAYFERIWEDFLAAGLCRVFIAEHEGRAVSAENFGIYKGAALYWTGATAAQGLELNAPSLVMWEAMRWMMAQGVEWFETGEAFPGAQGKLKGLNDFKKSFGGSLHPVYRGRMATAGRMQRAARALKDILLD